MMTKAFLSASLAAALLFSAGACAQAPTSYKPHLSVLAKEMPPSETPVDILALGGQWSGIATLITSNAKPGVCSSRLRITWAVSGTSIDGYHLNRSDIKSTEKGTIDERGRFYVRTRAPNGFAAQMSGWFSEDRAIGYYRFGNSADHCDFRVDMQKM